jgi:homocysteine S-methyltransferase
MTTRERIAQLLSERGVVILDGGLASELESRGYDLDDPLWSARLLLDEPEALAAVHRSYALAGADVVTSATYQATVAGMQSRGVRRSVAEDALRGAVALARRATRKPGPTGEATSEGPLIAASIGSYGAFLADGSEYRGDYGLDGRELAEFHGPRLDLLAPDADLLGFETIPSAVEVHAITRLLEDDGPPAWLSLSCRDASHLADGSPLEEMASFVESCPAIIALGVNCLPPSMVADCVATLRKVTDKPIVVYPNSGERFVGRDAGWEGAALGPEPFAQLARSWIELGARWIGGCCRTTPAHIRAIARVVDSRRGED